jgi:predicted ArsR family transcriptional regulator
VIGWTFLTNHAQVFLCVARNPGVTAREIGETVGITERAVQRILSDLEAAAYITRHRQGRRNTYEIHADRPFRHPQQQRFPVSELLRLIEP